MIASVLSSPRWARPLVAGCLLVAAAGLQRRRPPAYPAAATAAASVAGGYRFRVLARSGQAIAGSRDIFVAAAADDLDDNGVALLEAIVERDGRRLERLYQDDHGRVIPIMDTTETAPGGARYAGVDGPAHLDRYGDVAFAAFLDGVAQPRGLDAGAFYYHAAARRVLPVVLPRLSRAPGGARLLGVRGPVDLDGLGRVTFTGLFASTRGLGPTMGSGIFTWSRSSLTVDAELIAGHGDVDMAELAGSNAFGESVAAVHRRGEPCFDYGTPASASLYCAPGLDLVTRYGHHRLAHAGGPAPGGGAFVGIANARLNGKSQVAFAAELEPDPADPVASFFTGVFFYDAGITRVLARPGSAMPGGGTCVSASRSGRGNLGLNNSGEVAFSARLDGAGDGVPPSGLYLWSGERLRLVVRSGTRLPGIGRVTRLASDGRNDGAVINDAHQLLFVAGLDDGSVAVLVAEPVSRAGAATADAAPTRP